MKKLILVAVGVFAMALVGCNDCEDACDKLADCFDGLDKGMCVDECEEDDDQDEIDCVMDKSCSKIMEGACN